MSEARDEAMDQANENSVRDLVALKDARIADLESQLEIMNNTAHALEGECDAARRALVSDAEREAKEIVDAVLRREVLRLTRESQWNETRWKNAAERAQTDCTRRQWLEHEISDLRNWIGSYLPDNGFDENLQAEVQRRIDALLAGPPPKKEEASG